MAFPPETEAQVGAKPRGSLQGISGALAEDIAISMIPGLGDGLFDSEGNRHTSTYVKTYKNVDGKWKETPFTINDINSDDFVFLVGSKTGGENRERVAQNYRLQNGQFTPVGNPTYYKGAQDIGFFEGFVREGLPFVASFIPGLNVAIGTALGATSAVAAQALGNAVIQASLSVAAGAKPGDALKNAAASFGVSQLVPNLTGNPFIDNVIKSGATAALTNGDIGNAITNSLIATGAQAALSNTSITGDPRIDSGLVSGATSVAQAVATGGDPGQSFVRGFISGSTAKINQQEAVAQRAASGAGFVGDYEDLSGAGPADYVMGERDPALVQAGFFDSARGLVQSALADLGKSWLAAGQQIGIAPQTLQRAIDYLSVIEQGGEALISDDVKAQQQAFINKIYSVASDPNSTNVEKGRAIIEATLENPLGSLTLVSKEVIQELPQLLIPGRLPAMLGNFVLNIAESAGNQALQKIDELRQANPNMTNEQLVAAARNDAGVAGAVTAAMSLLPGMNTKVLQPAIQSFNEFLESGLTTYLLTGDRSKALGDAILGGVIGGKTTTALQTGEQVAEAAQQSLPSLGTITVSSTRLPPDQPVVADAGETLAITPSVVTKQGATGDVPVGQLPSAVVISTDPAKDTALVIDNSGQTKIVGATDAATGTKVTEGQTLTITTDNKLTSDASKVTPTVTTTTIDTKETAPTVTDTKAVTPDSTIKISEGVRREPTTYTGDLQGQRGRGEARLDELQRTFQGTLYPTVEARNAAMQAYYANFGIRATPEATTPEDTFTVTQPVVQPSSANLASVVNFLGQMGITPTNSMINALMEGGPTYAEILQRIQTNPEILAAVAARGQPQVTTDGAIDTGGAKDAGGNVVGDLVVTDGQTKVDGDVKADGEVIQVQKPAEVDVANQIASPQDVAALLGRMGLPTSAAFVAELTRDNATNAQVLQRLQADPAVQALIQQQRFGQTDTAIVVTVNPNNNTALVIDTKGDTKIIEAVDTKTGQTLVEDQVITLPVVTETAQTFTFDPFASLIESRFKENGKVATQEDIARLKAIGQQAGINFATEDGRSIQYQRWANLVNDEAKGIKPYVAPTVTPETKVDAGTKITPSVTESIDLTFDPGRVNIDTPEDTVQAQDTFSAVDTTRVIDTTPTFDTVVDTLPQDTVPTYGEDEDIIRFLGLDQQPTPTEPEAPPPEDTIGGGGGGTVNIPQEEQLAVAPKAVYTPKPGTRVVDTGSSVLPTRVQLSEGMGDDVEGTGEEEQQPVWNIRSLKLRRALGI